jgi:alanyl-tRNA synthetase
MIGQHAFMPPEKFAQTLYFRDLFEWFVDEMKIPPSEFNIIESQWGGGGNLGVSMEFFARGLEIANQVYMMYKTNESSYEPLGLKVLDMGMGQGRIAWLVNGSRTMYDAEYPGVCISLFKKSGYKPTDLFERFVPLGSVLDVDASDAKQMELMWKAISKQIGADEKELKEAVMPTAALYSIADHTQSLLFAICDGVLPSNVGGGYNLRAILRRSLGFINDYGWKIDLKEVAEWHAKEWKKQYPELVESLDEVSTILDYEERKYKETLDKSRRTVLSLIKKTKSIDFDRMVTLYESEGITPELIKDVARKEGVDISVPQDFYARVSAKHVTSAEQKKEETYEVEGLPATKKLYYDDVFEFNAKVLKEWEKNGRHYVVLDQTAFYPESGGQDCDRGTIDGADVLNVQKQGEVIVHEIGKALGKKIVSGKVDKERRRQLMRHHTATHIINGAAQRVLGRHVWQAGSEKKEDKARLDITHFEPLTEDQLRKIEELANKVVKENRPIKKEVLDRAEAERKYGFRIYQGGAIPSNEIRIVSIKDWDTEACGGTHANSTGEVGPIKLINSYKKQDGVIRLEYLAGEQLINKHTEKQKEKIEKDRSEWVEEIRKLEEELNALKAKLGLKLAKERLDKLKLEELIDKWKDIKKEIDKAKEMLAAKIEVKEMVQYVPGADMKVMQNIGRKIVEEDPRTCVVLISDGLVFGIKGKECKKDIEKAVKEAASIMGGSAGGREEIKGGGPLKEKSKEAYERAKKILK